MKFFKVFGSLVLITALLSSCGKKEKQEEAVPMVRLTTVETVNSLPTTSYPGKIYSRETSNVAFRVSGTLASVPVKEGQHVKRGQVLARMDDRDYRVQLQATEAEYAQIKAQAERVIALYEDEGTSQNNYDKARYGLEQITQKLQHHRDQLNDCVVTAPFDGYVAKVFHDSHETVAAGMPVVSVFALDDEEIIIHVPISEYLKRHHFEKFKATFSALENRTYDLHLINISHSANINQLYEVHLGIDRDDHEITPGMTTMVTISYKNEGAQELQLPATSIIHDQQGPAVFVYRDGHVWRTPVEMTFIHNSGMAEIKGDIQSGDQVVVSGASRLTNGQEVRPFPEPSETNVGGLL